QLIGDNRRMTATAAPPDWQTLQHDIVCPLCGYNLRGLSEPICPECGYRFEWRVILDDSLKLHPYLFEHHPERDVSSFADTLIATLSPRRFWAKLHPVQTLSRRRLLIYWIACTAPVIIATVAVALICDFNAVALFQQLHD